MCGSVSAAAAQSASPTQSTLSITGVDPYTMTCQVSGGALTGVSGPTGTVTFTDTTTGQDLATASLGTATQSIAFRDAQSPDPLTPGPALYPNPFATGIVAEDLNGDGIPDLVEISANQVVALLGKGDGTYTAQPAIDLLPLLATLTGVSSSQLNIYVASLVAGDFNGDGKSDVAGVITAEGPQGQSFWYFFFVLLGNGNGTFQTPTTSNLYLLSGPPTPVEPDGPDYLAAGDFNGDGKTDVAVSDGSTNTVDIFLGNATGMPSSPQSFPAGNLPTHIVAGAFIPGPLDLAVIGQGGVSVLPGNGDGTFKAPITTSLPQGGSNLVAGDFNQDGKLDLATLTSSGDVYLYLGNGDGTFQNPSGPISTGISNSGQWPPMGVADFNGDGLPDFWAVGGNRTGVGLNQGDGTFDLETFPFTGVSATAGDFNGDGRPDLAIPGAGVLNVYLQYTLATAQGRATNVKVEAGTISSHTLTCTYSGDSNYAGSASAGTAMSYQPAAVPIFSLDVGNYATAQSVSISDIYYGGSIYYTTDGSTPTTASTLYSGAITVSNTETLKAIAAPLGYTTSPVSEAVYTITDPPSFSVPGGTYTAQPSISITDGTKGAAIYYTTDGSTPGRTSAQYSQPITVVGTTTLKAVALASGNLFSPVVSASYIAPKGATTTAIQASILHAGTGQKVTLTATVSGDNPTGTVTFSTGTQSLGTATLANGTASLQTSFATAGSYSVSAAYSGDANNLPSQSGPLSVVVATPSFGVTSSPASQTISAGQSATFTFTVTPANGYTGTVDLSCGTLPSEASCSFSSSKLSITSSSAITSTLTISTVASTTSRNTPPRSPFSPWSGGMALAAVLGIGLTPGKMRRWNRGLRAWLCVGLLGALWLPLTGCGGGSTSPVKTSGTPAGTYAISVMANDSSGGSSTSAQVTLVVQ